MIQTILRIVYNVTASRPDNGFVKESGYHFEVNCWDEFNPQRGKTGENCLPKCFPFMINMNI